MKTDPFSRLIRTCRRRGERFIEMYRDETLLVVVWIPVRRENQRRAFNRVVAEQVGWIRPHPALDHRQRIESLVVHSFT